VIFAQLVLLALQVKNDQDVRIIRVWTITAVTPMARMVEAFRGGGAGFIRDYIALHDTNAENRQLRAELGRVKVENVFLRNELNTAERAKALQVFQAHTPSKLLGATVVGAGAGSGSKVVFVDAGSTRGVERGMAVLTPDGIVGKVIAAYPTASEVLLVTDPDFAAGVVSQASGVRGTLKGQGTPMARVDYVPVEEKVAVGDWFYTSGDDRIFPRGFPAGQVKVVRDGRPFKEILLEPSGVQHGVEDVLIVIEGAHQDIPAAPPANQPVYIAPAPPEPKPAPTAGDTPQAAAPPNPQQGTEADKLRNAYSAVGQAQGYKFGEPNPKPPDFTKIGVAPAPAAAAAPPATPAGKPAKTNDSTRLSNQAAGAPHEGKQD